MRGRKVSQLSWHAGTDTDGPISPTPFDSGMLKKAERRNPSTRSMPFSLRAGFIEELFKAALDNVLSAGTDRPIPSPVFRAPLARPGQIIALARNYTAHAAESTLPIPHEPIFFAKSNTSVVGPEEDIVLPPESWPHRARNRTGIGDM